MDVWGLVCAGKLSGCLWGVGKNQVSKASLDLGGGPKSCKGQLVLTVPDGGTRFLQ